MSAAKRDKSYRELSAELDEIVSAMQSETTDIDAVSRHYEAGLKIITELEQRLGEVQTTVTELKARSEAEQA